MIKPEEGMKSLVVGLVLCCSVSAVEAMPTSRFTSETTAIPVVKADVVVRRKTVVRRPVVVHKKVVKKVVVH